MMQTIKYQIAPQKKAIQKNHAQNQILNYSAAFFTAVFAFNFTSGLPEYFMGANPN